MTEIEQLQQKLAETIAALADLQACYNELVAHFNVGKNAVDCATPSIVEIPSLT